MIAIVIRIAGNKYSEDCAERCIRSAAAIGLNVSIFNAVTPAMLETYMKDLPFKWTWAGNNDTQMVHEETGLKQFPYDGVIETKMACFLSHYMNWKHAVMSDQTILVLEHDAVFIRELPADIKFRGICQINDPAGSFAKGTVWSKKMIARGTEGVHPKTCIQPACIPDGLAGNSAYMIKPWAAQQLIDKTHQYGMWPNDALMCIQLFPYLEEYFPFITKVVQKKSTSQGL